MKRKGPNSSIWKLWHERIYDQISIYSYTSIEGVSKNVILFDLYKGFQKKNAMAWFIIF